MKSFCTVATLLLILILAIPVFSQTGNHPA
jgi:hypothetical protein